MEDLGTVHVYHEHAASIAEAISLRVVPLATHEALNRALPEVEVLFAASTPHVQWTRATRLRLIQAMGAGVDDILPLHGLPASVAIASARAVFAPEAAEHAVAMLLALVRGLPTSIERQRTRTWRSFPAHVLAGSTLGLIGVGAIGARIARVARALEMRVIGVSRRARIVEHVDGVVTTERLHDVLPRCDHLIVTAPRTASTHPLLDAAALAATKPGVRIVHLSRGGVIDEAALLAGLERGHVGGLAIDVFDEEPLPRTSPWWSAPNTIVTPHLAGLGVRYLERVVERLLENVRRLREGEPLLGLVDRDAGY